MGWLRNNLYLGPRAGWRRPALLFSSLLILYFLYLDSGREGEASEQGSCQMGCCKSFGSKERFRGGLFPCGFAPCQGGRHCSRSSLLKTFMFPQPRSSGRMSSADLPERWKGFCRGFCVGTEKTRREYFKYMPLSHLWGTIEGSEG